MSRPKFPLPETLAAELDPDTLRAIEDAITARIHILDDLPNSVTELHADADRLRRIRWAFSHARDIQAPKPPSPGES